MEKIKHAHGYCPHCGKAVGGHPQERYEGSPLRTCKKCGGTYLDDRYSEVALYGEPENIHSVLPWLKGAGLLLVLGLAAAGFNLALLYFENRYYPVLWVMVACCVLGVLYELWQVLGVKTGRVARAYEKKRQASVARLQDPNYARLLAENGYPVPSEYLKDGSGLLSESSVLCFPNVKGASQGHLPRGVSPPFRQTQCSAAYSLCSFFGFATGRSMQCAL